jgi:hypothetical protein
MIIHAVERAEERYGLKLSSKDLDTICEECVKGYGRLTKMPDGKERHLIAFQGKPMIVVYAPYTGPLGSVQRKAGVIVTVLPEDAASPRRRKIKLRKAERRSR